MELQEFFSNKPLPELLVLFGDAEQFYSSGNLNNSPSLRSIAEEIFPGRKLDKNTLIVLTNEVYRQLAIIAVAHQSGRRPSPPRR